MKKDKKYKQMKKLFANDSIFSVDHQWSGEYQLEKHSSSPHVVFDFSGLPYTLELAMF